MPSRWSERRKRFRGIVSGDACIHPGSVHDPISARIAAELGFEVGMFAGSTASLTVLGSPDLITLTLTEFAQQALRINRAAELPLLCDADHGYGNALSVMRTVEELETAGVAGLSIEDTLLPQAFGSGDAQQILSLEEGVGKMQAALAGRRDPDLVIAGRTSAIQITGIEDTIRRAKAYEAVGVDAIFLVGVKTRKELETIAPNHQGADHSRHGDAGAERPRLSGQAGRAYLPAGASAVSGFSAGYLCNSQGAARRRGAEGPAEPCVG